MEIGNVCICGGGSLGSVIAGVLASQGIEVGILTGRPERWGGRIEVTDPEGRLFEGSLSRVSSDPAEVIPQAQAVLFCLPGFMIGRELLRIREHVRPGTFVGSVFSSTGFFFEAMKILDERIPLWGFQRVPFIARVREYGRSAALLGYKSEYRIAVERASATERERLRGWVEEALGRPTGLLGHYLEASITNSNPLLHTSRLYALFSEWEPGRCYGRNALFYHEWDDRSSELLIAMDRELFALIGALPVSPGFLLPILDYYESRDAASLTRKLRSIESFRTIASPMKRAGEGWIPDFDSRYFTEDFTFGLRYIRELARRYGVATPVIDRVYDWGARAILTYGSGPEGPLGDGL
ncbi:NAD/NADP octopine/nopaline dehydrogenase family protein [uncultured Alistipes sp.]|uniref:NAD/NADP octopine/nopaline dehydrogenase family protein n=1 Tax=uncultured Alistipes sp. TaxID=538949 RepID=UPI0026385817|nr:NAD/NADP octopine/nopaline dehydrogenase family protein [uncultured Alistipes sp.]